mmetsp:Transcript_30540/g.50571  ORF Transcript_30540/g.50571 Transcript_30540/m.50571 type:complete len:126 (-) Transcript_30540:304-681(-)
MQQPMQQPMQQQQQQWVQPMPPAQGAMMSASTVMPTVPPALKAAQMARLKRERASDLDERNWTCLLCGKVNWWQRDTCRQCAENKPTDPNSEAEPPERWRKVATKSDRPHVRLAEERERADKEKL